MQGRRRKPYDRYNNPLIGGLLQQLQERHQSTQKQSLTKLRQQRKMHHSYSLIESRRNQLETRPLFNNKTREGSLLDKKVKSIPYMFIPKYKNDTFIMPDKVFAKGKAGKRFHVKMKDTSIYSFRDPETEDVREVIRKDDKEKTIISRQVQEFNRIVQEADGVVRAKNNTQLLKTRKKFDYTHTGSQLFSQCQPLLEPKQFEKVIAKKVSLSKTYDFSKRWRPNSRNFTSFNETFNKSVYQRDPGRSSVL